jgi:hypothetical protein
MSPIVLQYSTHQEIKNTPLVLRVFLWRYVPRKNSNDFLTAIDRIFPDEKKERSIKHTYMTFV